MEELASLRSVDQPPQLWNPARQVDVSQQCITSKAMVSNARFDERKVTWTGLGVSRCYLCNVILVLMAA